MVMCFSGLGVRSDGKRVVVSVERLVPDMGQSAHIARALRTPIALSSAVQSAQLRENRKYGDRMSELDSSAAAVLDFLAQLGGSGIEEMSPTEARQAYEALGTPSQMLESDTFSVSHSEIAGVPCIVTVPSSPEPLPVLVWMHGGGWVVGSAQLSQSTAEALAVEASCIVVNVDYRLAPEHPHPAPLDDVVGVIRAVLGGELGAVADSARVAVGGDSAGGHLAASAALLVPGLIHQVLVYPITDMTLSHQSMERNGSGYLLTASLMHWFRDHYIGTQDPTDPALSPLRASAEALEALPPATLVLAGFDPLVDEGRAYADALLSSNVDVKVAEYPGQIHGFFSLEALIPEAVSARSEVVAELRAAFGV